MFNDLGEVINSDTMVSRRKGWAFNDAMMKIINNEITRRKVDEIVMGWMLI